MKMPLSHDATATRAKAFIVSPSQWSGHSFHSHQSSEPLLPFCSSTAAIRLLPAMKPVFASGWLEDAAALAFAFGFDTLMPIIVIGHVPSLPEIGHFWPSSAAATPAFFAPLAAAAP